MLTKRKYMLEGLKGRDLTFMLQRQSGEALENLLEGRSLIYVVNMGLKSLAALREDASRQDEATRLHAVLKRMGLAFRRRWNNLRHIKHLLGQASANSAEAVWLEWQGQEAELDTVLDVTDKNLRLYSQVAEMFGKAVLRISGNLLPRYRLSMHISDACLQGAPQDPDVEACLDSLGQLLEQAGDIPKIFQDSYIDVDAVFEEFLVWSKCVDTMPASCVRMWLEEFWRGKQLHFPLKMFCAQPTPVLELPSQQELAEAAGLEMEAEFQAA
jgi:hypothetical protein